MKTTRYFTYLFVSMWKVMVFFSCMVLFMYFRLENVGDLFSRFTDSFNQHKLFVNEVSSLILTFPSEFAAKCYHNMNRLKASVCS